MAMTNIYQDNVALEPADVQPFEFKIEFAGNPHKPPNLVAYVFNQHGALLTFKSVQEGVLRLNLDPHQAHTLRIFFGPDYPQIRGERSATANFRKRVTAYQAAWTFDPQKRVYEIMPIPEYLWRWWFLSSRPL